MKLAAVWLGLWLAPPAPFLPPVPDKALPATATARVIREFSAAGVTTVILRAADAAGAEVVTVPGSRVVRVSGLPTGGVVGYHSINPNAVMPTAGDWGLDFAARAFGPILVVSSVKEIEYIHHHFRLEAVRVEVPSGVVVVKRTRAFVWDAPDLSPDLRPPAAQGEGPGAGGAATGPS